MVKISCQPSYAFPPGETLRKTLETIVMTRAELAERTGRPKKTINEVIAGKAAITAETALQLERVLGIPASFWNNLERNYQEARARLKEEAQLQRQLKWLDSFPLSPLMKLGWIPKEDSPVNRLKAIFNFFGVAGIEEWNAFWKKPEAAYRYSRAYQANPPAVAAWLRKGQIEAAKIQPQPFNPNLFRTALKEIRSLTVEPPQVFEPKLRSLCGEAGVAIAFVPEIPGTHVYGATRWLKAPKALIQTSLRGKSNDHLWFAFFHDAGHIVLHGKEEIFIESTNQDGPETNGKRKEREADQFSRDFLIPPQYYQTFLQDRRFDPVSIEKLAAKLGIAPGIVVGRLQHDKAIPVNQGNNLRKK